MADSPSPTDWLRARLGKLDGVTEAPGRFGTVPGWRVDLPGGREIAHFHGDELDVRLTRRVIRERREELAEDPAVLVRGSSSDWVRYPIDSRDAAKAALALVRIAVSANQP